MDCQSALDCPECNHGPDRDLGLALRMGRLASTERAPCKRGSRYAQRTAPIDLPTDASALNREGKPTHRRGVEWIGFSFLDVDGGFLRIGVFFDLHIAELFGVKDLATLQALDKLGVFVPGNNTYFGVFADGCHRFCSVFYPPDCSGLLKNIKRIFVESLPISIIFPEVSRKLSGSGLKHRHKRSYTEFGPKKSDIPC